MCSISLFNSSDAKYCTNFGIEKCWLWFKFLSLQNSGYTVIYAVLCPNKHGSFRSTFV